MTDPYNACVIAREEINPALLVLRVKSDGELFTFKAGQYATLGLLAREPRLEGAAPETETRPPDFMIKRAYSIASGSVQRQYVEFIVTLVHSGEFTPRLYNLKIGGRLFMAPRAKGMFTLDRVPAHKHVVLIATGTGLAPYMSFLRSHLTPAERRKYVILHGARYSWDLGYRAELETLARVCPNFTYVPSITRAHEDPFFSGEVGRIQTLLERGVIEQRSGLALDPEQVDVFLCGNPDMIVAASQWLQARGFQEGKRGDIGTLHMEKYW